MKKIRIHLYVALIPVYCPGISRIHEGRFKEFENRTERWVTKWFIDAHKVVQYALANNFANGVQWCYHSYFKGETEATEFRQKIQNYCKSNDLKVEVSDLKNDLQFCMHPQIQFIRYFDILGADLDKNRFKEIFLEINPLLKRESLKNFIIC